MPPTKEGINLPSGDAAEQALLSTMAEWGVRITKGTLARPDLVPHDAQLLDAFCRRFGPRDDLSAGARALCKHRARYAPGPSGSGADCFWGDEILYGNSHQKNAAALCTLSRLLHREGCAWINLYVAFGGRVCFEARAASGHGARWLSEKKKDELSRGDPWVFAGFVEPQLVCKFPGQEHSRDT